MKNTTLWIIAIVIVLVGAWYVWPKGSVAPEATPTPTATPTVSPSASPTPTTSVQPKKTPTPTAQKTPTPTPTPTPIPTTTVVPTISAVTAYQMTSEPAGWWIRIVGSLSNSCAQLTGASFSRDDNAFMVSLPAQSVGQVCTQMVREFTQTVRLSDMSLAPGLYTVFVNDKNWTSFIVPSPTPSPIY